MLLLWRENNEIFFWIQNAKEHMQEFILNYISMVSKLDT